MIKEYRKESNIEIRYNNDGEPFFIFGDIEYNLNGFMRIGYPGRESLNINGIEYHASLTLTNSSAFLLEYQTAGIQLNPQ